MSPVNAINKTDVLIIGAGPAGLMCSVALGRYGVRTIVVDSREVGQTYGQADGVQPGTIEVWQSYGLYESLLREGWPMTSFATYSTNAESGGIERQPQTANVPVPDARYPFEVAIPIQKMEGILREAAESYGVQFEQPVVPIQLDFAAENGTDDGRNHNDYPVTITLDRQGEAGHSTRWTIHAKYVVGCDGARSWVRKTVGIPMERSESKEEDKSITWGVIDFTPWIPRPGGTARIYVPLQPQHANIGKDGLLPVVQEMVNKVFRPYEMNLTNCTWASTYKVVQQVAATYCVKSRVFIAGDACHTHSPKAGQGANASMRDAHNLAWKLSHVLKGWAKPGLLSTYNDERRPYAQELIRFDKDISKAFQLGGDDGKYNRIWNEKSTFISGIGIVCRSALTPTETPSLLAPRLIPGGRIPPSSILRVADWTSLNVHDILVSDGIFKLLIFCGDINTQYSTLQEFAEAVCKGMKGGKGTQEMLSMHTILSKKKTEMHWTDVPGVLRDALSIYVDDILTSTVHEALRVGNSTYGLYGIGSQGAAVLVRPDAHISLVVPVNLEGAQDIVSFLLKI